jgi:hypothetical protein
VTSAWRLLWLTLKEHWLEALGLALLATLPAEILNTAMNWGAMDPGSYLAEAAWLPVTMLCQLALLRRMGRILNPESGSPQLRGSALASAIGAEFLISLRFCVVVLLWALPALIFLSIFGLEAVWARVIFALLALLASIPCLLYMLRRLLSPAVVLWQGLKASASLDESARLTAGKLSSVIWPLIVMNGIGLILEGLSDSLPFEAFSLPLSFLLSSAALAWSYRILTL